MADIILNVNPEQLTSKAGELKQRRTAISSLIESAKQEITSLKSVWESTASDELQSRYNQAQADIEKVLKIVDTYVDNLTTVAATYKNAESQATDSAQALPTNVFTV